MAETKIKYPIIASAIVVIALLAAIHFDAFEDFAAWARRYDGWRVNELLFLPIFPAIASAFFSWRRRGGLEGEATQRERVEEDLRQQRDLYEGVLTALSELGEGLVVIEDERIRHANDAFCEIKSLHQ